MLEQNTIEEMQEVIQAFKEGKKIMFQDRLHSNTIGPAPAPCWDFSRYRFFVRPEPRKPRTIFVNIYDEPLTKLVEIGRVSFHKKDCVESLSYSGSGEIVEFVEVVRD